MKNYKIKTISLEGSKIVSSSNNRTIKPPIDGTRGQVIPSSAPSQKPVQNPNTTQNPSSAPTNKDNIKGK